MFVRCIAELCVLLIALCPRKLVVVATHSNDYSSKSRRRFVSFGKVTFPNKRSIPTERVFRKTLIGSEASRSSSRRRSISSKQRKHVFVRPVSTTTLVVPTRPIDTLKTITEDENSFDEWRSAQYQHDEDDGEYNPLPKQKMTPKIRLTANLPTFSDLPSLVRGFMQPENKAGATEPQPNIDTEKIVASLSQPLIEESVWNQLTGTEFQDYPELLEALATMGEGLARNDAPGPWIDWQGYGTTTTSVKMEKGGAIRVWTGKCVRNDGGCYYGSQLPFIKTRSVLPLSVHEMVDLLMDSSRVQTYNPWSLGRRDCWVHDAYTKIVKNRIQPPLGSKAMVSTTLLHARPCVKTPTIAGSDGDWIVVSRSIGGGNVVRFAEPDDATAGRSDILLGVNLLQPIDDDSCLLTAITHVYSSAVPNMLAERLGIKSAIKFVKDMRSLKVATAV